MTTSEELRLICLELAIATPHVHNQVAKAREYYAYIKERDGANVLKSNRQIMRVK